MPALEVDNVHIEFPHEPYDCQREYMHKLLQALQQGRNAILESPTGTGKTLCLLCTSLAWLSSYTPDSQINLDSAAEADFFNVHPNKPKVIFASRTHSQLAQAVTVLKNTVYSSRNISVIGSRDQLCLLPEVTSLESNSAKIFACRVRVQTRTCDYFRNFDLKRDDVVNTLKANGVVDIEDLVTFGKSTRCCPYYMSRELKTDAEIVFMPYNYLLDGKIRRLYNIDLENAVVIFDEAHNIEQVCEDAASVTLSSGMLASAIEYLRVVCEVVFSLAVQSEADQSELQATDGAEAFIGASTNLSAYDISRAGEDKLSSLNLERLLSLKGQLIELERLVDSLDVTEEGITKPSDFLFDLLGRAGLTHQTRDFALQTIEEVLSVATAAENAKLRKPKGITEVSEFIKTVFESKYAQSQSKLFSLSGSASADYSRCYRVFVKDDQLRSNLHTATDRVWDSRGGPNQSVKHRILSYWCLSPGRAMQDLIKERVRCVILTSGTLYPVEPIQAELRMPFPILLQNPHVIKPDQVRLAVITRGKDGQALNSGYASRDKPGYRSSLGLTLIELFKTVPNGLLVFFPSYAMMNQCVDAWKSDQLYDHMLSHKRIFVEPRDKVQFTKVFTDYRNVASGAVACDVNGAALFAVMRGRASEGLDLADYAGRGVAILGLPYPPFQDPRVKLKMAYLDEQKIELSNQASFAIKYNSDHKLIAANHPTGRKWYNQQAWRAVNQSIGRVIRHHRDFGAIFLCDERFAPVAARSQLPHWMQSSIRIYSEWNSFPMETCTFFKNAMKQYPPIAATLTGQSTQSSLVKPSAYKPLKSQSNSPSFGFNQQKLSNLPCASETLTFSHSLAQHHSTPDGDSLLANYMKSETPSHLSISVLKSSSSSIFNSIDNQPDESATSSTISVSTTGESKEDALEAKLLQSRPSKRIRLCRAIENLPTDNTSCLDPATYLAAVKSTLISSLGTGTNRDFIRDFKEALRTYKESTTSNTVDCLNNDNMECLHVLHNKLATIFACDKSKKLLTGVTCFLLPAHRSYYAELCKQRTLLTTDQANCSSFSSDKGAAEKSSDNTIIECSKCHSCPARTPLVSTCNHIACFGCWRTIIEDGNRRCPSCHCLVRRRNLTRLVVQPANVSQSADA